MKPKRRKSVTMPSIAAAKMTRKQAIVMAKRLHLEGSSYEEISEALAKKGYIGPKSNKPVSSSTLSQWLGAPTKGKPRKVGVVKKEVGRLELVKTMLMAKDFGAEDKVAMALLLIDAD